MVYLELTNCKNCTSLPTLGGLPFLKYLVIEGMNQVKSIGDGFYGVTAHPFRSLESRRFENMPEWNNWLIPKLGHEETEALFLCLRELRIIKCPKLINLPDELPSLVTIHVKEWQELEMLSCLWERLAQPLMVLEDLGIHECDELACLRKPGFGLENLGGLRRLWINGCDGVVSLEEQGLPCNLQYLEVNGCFNLEKLPNALHALTSLTDLVIWNCPKIVSFLETNVQLSTWKLKIVHLFISFPEGELPATLKKLIIEDCEKLESLPEGIDSSNTCRLELLYVWGCPSLKSIPRGYFPSTLEILDIWDRQQLESIPGNMLQNLTFLQLLNLCNCPYVVSSPEAFLKPNLKALSITDCENMRWPLSGWSLHTLTSLGELCIQGPFPDMLSFSGSQLLLPISLTTLRLGNLRNLKSIASMDLQSLISLKTLELYNCPELRSFVPKEGLLPTLARLVIWECPILKKRCLKDKGKDWPKIAHIPYVEIDDIVFGVAYSKTEECIELMTRKGIDVDESRISCHSYLQGLDLAWKTLVVCDVYGWMGVMGCILGRARAILQSSILGSERMFLLREVAKCTGHPHISY
ncbi:putative disease resistance RPP13-like protein 1 [Vitis vinifera]|uniref:Putative disease resistance RPP13-like protein 1 n=1 Tax=Vitis vinifera TaxID=29760 RepID=A0A438I7Q3_VITVI|nr:putative disease resistance RPP13-like protein 1 [Vitis vinifera]